MTDDGLTVAIISLVGGAPLAACVDAMRGKVARLLVVHRNGSIRDEAGAEIGRSETADVPARRLRAAQLATTSLVAMVEDTVVPHDGWGAAVVGALAKENAVAAGGPVMIDPTIPPGARALALTEYGRFRRMASGGDAVGALPGCNMAFWRRALLAALPAAGLIDNEVFERLAVAGGQLYWAPGMMVTYHANHAEGARLATRFGHGRLYASRRLEAAGAVERLAGAVKALALPPVLMLRTLRDADREELRSPQTLLRAALQHGAWAAGEFTGALRGPAPGGLAAWR